MRPKCTLVLLGIGLLAFTQCTEKKEPVETALNDQSSFGGYESQIKWGEHLVIIGACPDCHTPKKMTPRGPVFDSTFWLAGHPSAMPAIQIDRKEIESKGLAVTMDLTEWVGPWGVSYSANLTPDDTGIGNWKEEQFIFAIREGKYKGLPESRPLLPPMPWDMYRNMRDEELKAVFAYLKSIKPVNNVVPPPLPPVSVVP